MALLPVGLPQSQVGLQPFAGGHEVRLADDVAAVEDVLSFMM